MPPPPTLVEPARWGTPAARRVLVACVLGSSMAFLDSTVVNVALPRIGADLGTGLAGLQWVLDAYLVTLAALVLLGGSLGDRYGRRRMFDVGVVGFTAASLLCGLAPSIGALVAARALQGVAAALLVPGSLALLTASFHADDRSRAVGAWSGLTGVAGAVGPLLGGWLVDALSWRWVFLVNLPVAAAVLLVARQVPEHGAAADARAPLDVPGAAAAALALGLTTAGVIGHGASWSVPVIVAGVLALAGFVVVEHTRREPMVPPALFSSPQFSGANAVTLVVYAGLGVALFLVVVDLQHALGYAPVAAGAATLPLTFLVLLLSARMGALARRIGPRLPMTVGPVVAGAGLALLSGLRHGDSYASGVLPGMAVLGLGLATTVAPLTAAVMAAVDESHLGLASGVNNAVARLASLLGVAVVPAVAGVDLAARGSSLPGYRAALVIAAVMCAAGGAVAAVTIRRAQPTRPTVTPSLLQPCHDPCRLEHAAAA